MGTTEKPRAIIEKLEGRIAQAVSVQERTDLMNRLAWQLRIQNPARASALSMEAMELSKSSGDENAIASSLVNLAFLDGEAGNLETSLVRSLDALAHLKEPFQPDILITAWYTMGWTHHYSGSYPAALEFGLKALKLAREIEDKELEAWCLDLVACTYKDSDRALQMYEAAFAIFEELNHVEGQSRILNNWAYTLMESKQFAEALELSQRSLLLAKLAGLKHDEINITATMSEILAGLGDYEQAQERLNGAIAMFDEYGRDISSIFVLVALGQVYLRQNRLDDAEQVLIQALEESSKMEMLNEQARCHQYLSEIFERRGMFEKALDHYKNFQTLRESIAGETTLKEVAALRVSHQIETAQRDSEIHRLQKEKLQHELDQHKRLHAMLEELATRDSLTNLYNRRHFLGLAEREWRRSIRYRHPLCALMLDVDDFKQINDVHGHAVGDTALIAFANIIQSTLRSTELAGRYGGDEFVVLLPETIPEHGILVAKRICQSIADHTIDSASGPIGLTPSIGVACLTNENRQSIKSLTELLYRADKALYTAKKLGRGQVQLYSETE